MKSYSLSILINCVCGALFVTTFICCNGSNVTPKASADDAPQTAKESSKVSMQKNIIFFGNSLTAGFGLEDINTGFVALAQRRLDSIKNNYHCINAGLSGETTSGGVARVDWVIAQQPFDIFILELGGNDALRGINPVSSEKNLQTIIDRVRAKNASAKIILAGMEAPRNMGKDYDNSFHTIYPTLAKKNNIAFIPFILDNVGGVETLNQSDGIHPNVEGNKIVVENIWRVLKNKL